MTIKEMKAAIAVFEKYVDVDMLVFHAEHDYLSGPHVDHMPNITSEDADTLEQLGWRINGEDCWEHGCSC